MKRRIRKIANFFAFNLLFFALYLNFIRKDKVNLPVEQTIQPGQTTAAFSGTGTVPVDDPEKYLEKKHGANVPIAIQQPVVIETPQNITTESSLSIN